MDAAEHIRILRPKAESSGHRIPGNDDEAFEHGERRCRPIEENGKTPRAGPGVAVEQEAELKDRGHGEEHEDIEVAPEQKRLLGLACGQQEFDERPRSDEQHVANERGVGLAGRVFTAGQ